MGDDYEVGHGKPPAKTRFQKGKSGNPSGRPKRRNPPKEPLNLQKALIAELKSPMTINEGGNKKRVTKLQALAKALVAGAFHDKGTRKYLFHWIAKLPEGAFADEESHTFRVSPSTWDLFERIEQDVATWPAFRARQQTMPPAD
jgi:hypothetical protein